MLTPRKSPRRKRGFTLIETVVTVGIIASLAAVVIPQVVNQFEVTDAARVQNDLKNLQTAIETFRVNVKEFPHDLDDLVNAIAVTDTALDTSTDLQVYTATQVGFWEGPYADFAFVDNTAGTAENSRLTGFGATILDSFVCYNAADNTHGTSVGVTTAAVDDGECPNNAGQKFLAIQLSGLAAAATDQNFLDLNELFDGTEASPGTTGRVRFDANGAGTDIVYFLAVPIS